MNDKITLEELNNIFYARQFAYDILRRFFVEEPSKEYLKEFVQKNLIDLFPFKEDSEEIKEAIGQIKDYLSSHDVVNIEKHYQQIHWEYTRLFVGPSTLPAPPWESYYVRGDQLLFQETTMSVRRYYQKYQTIVRDFNIEADDHIGLELDFIFHVNELCIQYTESKQIEEIGLNQQLLKDQQQFINEHLLKFSKPFSQLVEQNAETMFFVGLAKILHHFLLIDSKVLQELLSIDILIKGGTQHA